MLIKLYLLLFMDESGSVEKIIFFIISDRKEQIEFSSNDSSKDVKELFRVAAEANKSNILKLCDSRGHILCISNRLTSNNSEQRYRLYVYSTIVNSMISLDNVLVNQNLDMNLNSFMARSSQLCLKKYKFSSSENTLDHLVSRLSIIQSQFELLEFMTWLGFSKDISEVPTFKYFWNKEFSIKLPNEHISCVYQNFLKLRSPLNKEHLMEVKSFKFNSWNYTESSLLYFIHQIFIDLNFMEDFKIRPSVFRNWIKNVYSCYNNVPYHSFKHAFVVTQLMYSFFTLLELNDNFDKLTTFSLIIASLCHDIDHPGFNNNFLNNTRNSLALRYNDKSPLENNHCYLTFKILAIPDCNILENLSRDDYKLVRQNIIKCILATDMLYHNQIMDDFLHEIPIFSLSNVQHKELLMKILIKLADIGIQCKPQDASYQWPYHILREFTNQADIEKMLNIPVSAYMFRDTAYKKSSQFSFLTNILRPLVQAVAELFPVVNDTLMPELLEQIDFFKNIDSLL